MYVFFILNLCNKIIFLTVIDHKTLKKSIKTTYIFHFTIIALSLFSVTRFERGNVPSQTMDVTLNPVGIVLRSTHT